MAGTGSLMGRRPQRAKRFHGFHARAGKQGQGAQAAAQGAEVLVSWTGPNNPGDYLTIVPKAAKDGAAIRFAYTSRGSPARIRAPKEAGACEIRYMSGQKNLVLARADIEIR